MSFCCGADMLLTVAHLRQESVSVANVPVLFCLTCENIIVHPDVELEYQMLVDYAIGDRAQEVDLFPYVNPKKRDFLYDPKNHIEYFRLNDVVKEQIDRALDLYAMAISAKDSSWQEEIAQRLKALHSKNAMKQD